jgi:hypothetical protein
MEILLKGSPELSRKLGGKPLDDPTSFLQFLDQSGDLPPLALGRLCCRPSELHERFRYFLTLPSVLGPLPPNC